MSEFATHSLANVSVIVAGIPINGGWGDADEVIKIERTTEDKFNMTIGAGGDVMRWENLDDSAVVTLVLLPTALANDLLMAVFLLDKATKAGVGPFLIRDALGRATHAAPKSFVMSTPKTVTYGRQPQMMEWKIGIPKLAQFIGGS